MTRQVACLLLPLLLICTRAEARPHRRGSLVLTTSTYGATVTVDGHDSGVTPLSHPIALRPGAHTLHVAKPGFLEFEQKFSVNADASTPIFVQLQKAEPGAGDLALVPLVTGSPAPGPATSGPAPSVVLTPAIADLTQPPSLINPNPLEAPLQTSTTITADNWYNQWWIWTAAGVILAGAATGIAVGVAHNRPAPGPKPNATWSLGNPISSATQGLHVAF